MRHAMQTRLVPVSLATLSFGLSLASAASAQDSCDYLGRHRRRDIVPVSVQVSESDYQGDIYSPHATAVVLVRSVGDLPLGEGSFQYKTMRVSVGGHVGYGNLMVPLAPGQERTVAVNFPKGTSFGCYRVTVSLDLDKSVGQWGCGVFADDTKLVPLSGGNIRRCVSPRID